MKMAVLIKNMLTWTQVVSVWLIASVYLVAIASAEDGPYLKSENMKTTSPIPSLRGHVVEQADVQDKPSLADRGFIHGFVAAVSVIVVSELGDKTFFIAAIMAMKHPRLTVFIGAISALAFMTVLSAVFGWVAQVIPRVYTYYISTALFAIFGLKMLRDGYYMSPNEGQEELEEVQSDLRKREDEVAKRNAENQREVADLVATTTDLNGTEGEAPLRNEVVIDPSRLHDPSLNDKASSRTVIDTNADGHLQSEVKKSTEFDRDGSTGAVDVEGGLGQAAVRRKIKSKSGKLSSLSRILIQAFMMTFLAEWGDRSQLATIVMAASYDVIGVTIGGILGHAFCTGLAVLGGRMIAQRISVRTVTIIGGVVFLIFAISALFLDPNDT